MWQKMILVFLSFVIIGNVILWYLSTLLVAAESIFSMANNFA